MNKTSPATAFRKRAVIRRPITRNQQMRNSAPLNNNVSRSASRNGTAKSTSRSTAKSTSEGTRNKTYLNDPDCIALREKLYDDPDFTDLTDEDLQKLQAHLREYSQDKALNEDYEEAKKASDLSDRIKSESQSRQMAARERDANNMINEKKATFEENWNEKFRVFDEETKRKREEIVEKQKERFAKFETLWSDEMPRKYRKASQQLLQIRQIERSLAMTGKYEEARAMHTEAEKLAAKEAVELQSNLIRDYRAAKVKEQQKYQTELDKFDRDRAGLRAKMESTKELEGERIINRDLVVEHKKTEAKKGSRQRSGVIVPDYGASVWSTVENKAKPRDNIIPLLFAPNDPKFVEEDEKRQREKRKRQAEFQKKHAEEILLDYTVQPSPRSEKTEDMEVQENAGDAVLVHDIKTVIDDVVDDIEVKEEEEAESEKPKEENAPEQEKEANLIESVKECVGVVVNE